MKLVLSIIVVVITLIIIYFFVLGYLSKKGNPVGLISAQLAPCEQKPNCICSEFPADQTHFVLPINYSAITDLPDSLDVVATTLTHTPEDIIRIAKQVVIELGGAVQTDDDSHRSYPFYLAAIFKSSLFGFVDDVELRFDSKHNLLHLRSASRVGRSDFGANLKRIEKLKARISARLSLPH